MNISGKRPRVELPISFSDDDLRSEVKYHHCDALVIHAIVGKQRVKRILIDDGSNIDIIIYDAISEMGRRSDLQPFKTELYGFRGHPMYPKGRITLPVKVGDGEHTITHPIEFIVVDTNKWYNAILGRPTISILQIVV